MSEIQNNNEVLKLNVNRFPTKQTDPVLILIQE